MLYLRTIAFFLGYAIITIAWGSLSCLVAWLMPYRWRFYFIIGAWTRLILYWLRLTCGIRVRVSGKENIPAIPCLIFSKHESTWETIFLQTLFAPQATLIKKELLWIPFFGWAFALLRPIAIDRSSPRTALKKLIAQGGDRLASGIWVLIFPEGTRTTPHKLESFQAGGPALASHSDAPILVVTHNAGTYWPAHRFLKFPGTIELRIAKPLQTTGLSSKQIKEKAQKLMREELDLIKHPD